MFSRQTFPTAIQTVMGRALQKLESESPVLTENDLTPAKEQYSKMLEHGFIQVSVIIIDQELDAFVY